MDAIVRRPFCVANASPSGAIYTSILTRASGTSKFLEEFSTQRRKDAKNSVNQVAINRDWNSSVQIELDQFAAEILIRQFQDGFIFLKRDSLQSLTWLFLSQLLEYDASTVDELGVNPAEFGS